MHYTTTTGARWLLRRSLALFLAINPSVTAHSFLSNSIIYILYICTNHDEFPVLGSVYDYSRGSRVKEDVPEIRNSIQAAKGKRNLRTAAVENGRVAIRTPGLWLMDTGIHLASRSSKRVLISRIGDIKWPPTKIIIHNSKPYRRQI